MSNESGFGAVMFLVALSTPVVSNCIFAFNDGDITVFSADRGSAPEVNCCDIYGNSEGNWVGVLDGLDTLNGNFSLDPEFSDFGTRDLRLNAGSPCLPAATGCGQVGALGEI